MEREEGIQQEEVTSGAEIFGGAEEAPEEEVTHEIQEEATPDEPIMINGQSFATQKEAFAYAEELERKLLISDSYQQGIADATQVVTPQSSEAEPKEPEDDFEQKFYEDPKKYLTELRTSIRDEVKAEINTESAQANEVAEMWKGFYSENNDLSGKDKIVNMVLQENWDLLSTMPDRKKALGILAQETRKEIRTLFGDSLPKEELARTENPVSSGGGEGVTQVEKEEEAGDFISELRKHQAGRY